MKTEKTEGFIFKEEPIDNTEQDENDGEPIQKKRKIENQMIDYQNTIPTLELIQGMFFEITCTCNVMVFLSLKISRKVLML